MALSGGCLRPLKDRSAGLEFQVLSEDGRKLGAGPCQVKLAKFAAESEKSSDRLRAGVSVNPAALPKVALILQLADYSFGRGD